MYSLPANFFANGKSRSTQKRHSLSESVLFFTINYFRTCLSIQMFLLKLAI